jgi:Tfp pilus assembly protein PilZ
MTTSPPKASERRDGPRIDLRLRVRWSAETSAGPVSGEAEASDVSPKGLRLESEHAVDAGRPLHLVVDMGGDTDELVAEGKVMWCRSRPSPTGKTTYDVGVAFESDWLAKERGPLGQALARIFAMNAYEPARVFARTDLSVAVDGNDVGGVLELVNLSQGGMQVKSSAGASNARAGMNVQIVIDADTQVTLTGRVAWVATQGTEDRFGVEFSGPGDGDRTLLERICTGQAEPRRIALALRA